MRRASGILLPISALPSRYGIGAFSKEAYTFVDQLKEAGQSFWQILPLGPTSYGDSPYQSFSTFAGNPYYIDLEELIREGVLTRGECEACDFGGKAGGVDYGKLYRERFTLLRRAYERSGICRDPGFQAFVKENASWLWDYALFMAVKDCFGGAPWNEWAQDIRLRREFALDYYREVYYYEIEFYQYLQYKFQEQWLRLKQYANTNGIRIVGDLPIYVAFDSADAWAGPDLFQFDGENLPTAVAGCPPDAFSKTGQLWGNPLYRWERHRDTGYDWWCRRMERCYQLYDVVRIDHFRGFDAYYSIPYGEETAMDGRWESGPGMELFDALEARLGRREVIAEDLGLVTPSVEQLVRDSGFPNMKVLEFGFDPEKETGYLPHEYDRNCVVYTGTHDNDTVVSWFHKLRPGERALWEEYLDRKGPSVDGVHWDMIRLAMMSAANLCIIPAQDYLGLGGEARMNYPSTLGGNWKWRLKEGELTPELLGKIRDLTRRSFRMDRNCRTDRTIQQSGKSEPEGDRYENSITVEGSL